MKYQVTGDLYYIAECDVRANFYNIIGIPATKVNGQIDVGSSFYGVTSIYDSESTKPGLLDFAATHSFSGTTINVNVNVLPFFNFDDCRLQIAVFEYETTGNVGTNGETEFPHVLMKMMPDAEGTVVNLTDIELFSITETFDLANTNIEEYDDLGVVVFLQSNDTKEIYQSTYSIEDAIFSDDATLSQLLVDGVLIDGFSPDVFSYIVDLPTGTTQIPEVTFTISDTNATGIIVPAFSLPGSTEVHVFAEDLNTFEVYTVEFKYVGVDNLYAKRIKLYPIPVFNIVNISGLDETSDIIIYDAIGNIVDTHKNFYDSSINMEKHKSGIYFMGIMVDGELKAVKKIVLIK